MLASLVGKEAQAGTTRIVATLELQQDSFPGAQFVCLLIAYRIRQFGVFPFWAGQQEKFQRAPFSPLQRERKICGDEFGRCAQFRRPSPCLRRRCEFGFGETAYAGNSSDTAQRRFFHRASWRLGQLKGIQRYSCPFVAYPKPL